MKTLLVFALLVSSTVLPAQGQPCNTGQLDPRVASALKTTLGDLPVSSTISVEQIRDVRIQAPAFPAGDMHALKITADSIPIQVYNPGGTTGLPIIIHYHPGGFVTPLLPFMQYECWRQANAYRAIVVAVDYRVAPEYKFPAAVNDAYNAFKWIQQHGQAIGGDPDRIMVLGLSAGGNLAAVVCQKARQDGLAHKIKLQVLNCPSTDTPRHAARYPSYQQYASGYFLTKAFCQFYINAYAPNVVNSHPEVAPIQRNDVSGLPPALIITAEFDPLRDEGHAYAERLKKAGVWVQYHCFPGQIHCLLGLPPEAEQHQQADELVRATMNTFLK